MQTRHRHHSALTGRRPESGRGPTRLRCSLAAAGPLLLLSASVVSAQLTLSDNQLWREDDFASASVDAGNWFGAPLAVCDFDGDGYGDLAIAATGAAVLGLIPHAGMVHVLYGGRDGLSLAGSQTRVQPAAGSDPPEEDDYFGLALAGGDFNGDGYCDLAVGSQDEIDGHAYAGSVHVFSGTGGGLTATSQVWTRSSPGITGAPGDEDGFGATLAAGNLNGDAFDDLVVGAPGLEVDGFSHAGGLHVLLGSMQGLTPATNDLLVQGGLVDGAPQNTRQFGEEMIFGYFDDDRYADLAIGVRTEEVDGISGAGVVRILYGGSEGFDSDRQDHFQQNSPGIGLAPGDGDYFGLRLAAGDFDGDGLDELAVSAAYDDVGLPGAEAEDAGVVVVLRATAAGLTGSGSQVWSQESTGVSDDPEAGDHFGRAVAAGDFDRDGLEDLAIGVDGEDFENGGLVDNGAVHVLYGTANGLSAAREQYHGQGVWGAGATESGDRFGRDLATGDFDRDGVDALVAGIPYEGVMGESEAGAVVVITGVEAPLFVDGFESGETSAWSWVVP